MGISNRTWSLRTVAPSQAVALGKYAVAVVWSICFGVLSAIGVSALSGVDNPLLLAATLISAVLAALYRLIGAAFYRRATVFAFVMSVVLEGVVSLVPAMINQLTVAYRLRSIVAKAMSVSSEWTLSSMWMGRHLQLTDLMLLRQELSREEYYCSTSSVS